MARIRLYVPKWARELPGWYRLNDIRICSHSRRARETTHARSSRTVVAIFALIAIALVMMGQDARAADITLDSAKNASDFNLIAISGEIVDGDDQKFQQVASNVTPGPVVVSLSSPGGNVMAALGIGGIIHDQRFKTVVFDGAFCASSCGLIWVAGAVRLYQRTAHIGFHAAYSGSGGQSHESGAANAVVGAYLRDMGLSLDFIIYATSAAPTDMAWLSADQLGSFGIAASLLPEAIPSMAPAPTPTAPQTRPSAMSMADRAKLLVSDYYTFWSKSGADVSGMVFFYGSTVSYFGDVVPASKVMEEKQKFSMRWPVRSYAIQPGTLDVQCDTACTVTGAYNWDVSSVQRGAHSTGVATFAMRVAFAGSTAMIVSENGSVLSAHNDTLPASVPQAGAALQPQAPDQQTSIAYLQGRQARIDYEGWFEALPEDDFREGALFWATNRSNTPPPSCKQPRMSTYWQQGCAAGRGRLANSDIRRKTETDFKAGWNSL